MKKKILSLLAAFFMLFGTSAMAQVDSTLEGDVNGDGVVDIADITAVIAIIKQNAEANPTYYWYVGQENPANMTSISPVVTDNTSPGWRLIGTSIPTYSASNPLWNADDINITFTDRNIYYIAVPNASIKIYNVANGSVMDSFTTSEVTINGVKYTIYTSTVKGRVFLYKIF